MTTPFTVACVQTSSARDVADSLGQVAPLVRQARAQGADLILTPENVALLEPVRALKLAKAEPEEGHQALAAFQDLARETGAWLLVGSLAVKVAADRLANRSYLLSPDGGVAAKYDKLHLFDVDLPTGESHRESATIAPGDRAVLVATPWGPLGMSVCYDLRFAHLYRALAKAGALYLTVPAAFTVPTGQAHWHVLLRARAIETGCFVFAPAQCGTHAEGRRTYGHSLIVAPWGEILAEAGDEPTVILARVDPAQVEKARGAIPALSHDRAFLAPTPVAGLADTAVRAAGE